MSSSSVTFTSTSSTEIPWYFASVLAAVWVTVPSSSSWPLSCDAVTVTVWAVSQLAGVKVRSAGSAVTSVLDGSLTVMVTSWVG